MHRILFVCTGNRYRSPIAAEAFRSQLRQDGRASQWTVNSAGTWAASEQSPSEEAIELARSYGLTIDGHKTHTLTATMLAEADLVIVMEAGHKESIRAEFPFAREKVYLLSQVVEGITYDIPDPATAPEEVVHIMNELVALIQTGYRKICKIAEAD